VLVNGVMYRHPGLLAKTATTLDVLSRGRAVFGLGAAWYGREHTGLGVPYPPTAERFERLEETLQICRQMWGDDDGPYRGKHYSLDRTLDSPHPLHRPRIIIGGGGEKKTLRLVAKYGDGCNLFGGPEAAHKLDVLREHCQAEGRDYDEIEKTTMIPFDVSDSGKVRALLQQLEQLRGLGFTVANGIIAGPDPVGPLQILGRDVVPEVVSW
jgi:alkanesulfonate monooxygenase SsuD/methylene tetrahydromethanopterin reductase-like flavin-dependent oxidoreductase (luciferase family)